jgi:plastocyanin
MIWRLVICFSAFGVLCGAATVQGAVAIQDATGKAAKKHQLSGVVVWLDPIAESGAVTKVNAIKTRMVQKNKTFTPHVLPIPIGSTVDFPNSDPIFHNAFSNYNGQIFDIGLYPPGSTRSVKFRSPGIVRVFCNIHSTMSAVIVVLKSPWYATSDEDGAFELEGVPEGSYRLGVYYERATEQTLAALQKTVTVTSQNEDLGVISVSESGYLAIPHLNKFGKPYPPANADPGAYPGARQ